ncbi:hypothetical protein [Streptomyces violascens]
MTNTDEYATLLTGTYHVTSKPKEPFTMYTYDVTVTTSASPDSV